MAHVQISAFLMESGEEWKVVGWDEMRASCLTFLQPDGNRWIRPDACQRRSLSKIYGIPSKIGWISTHKVTSRQKLTLSSESHRCVFAFRSGNVPPRVCLGLSLFSAGEHYRTKATKRSAFGSDQRGHDPGGGLFGPLHQNNHGTPTPLRETTVWNHFCL